MFTVLTEYCWLLFPSVTQSSSMGCVVRSLGVCSPLIERAIFFSNVRQRCTRYICCMTFQALERFEPSKTPCNVPTHIGVVRHITQSNTITHRTYCKRSWQTNFTVPAEKTYYEWQCIPASEMPEAEEVRRKIRVAKIV